MTNFEEGLGRVMYVVGALEYERPFLGPLYRFLVLHPRGSARRVPGFVKFILRFLAAQIEQTRHYSCAVELRSAPSAPRVDAQESDTRTGLGSWLPTADEKGSIQKWLSPWFSLEIDKAHFPKVYEKDDRPALVIASLEALATLLALKAFYGETPGDYRSAVQVLPTWTDNRGNGSILNKLMCTRYPVSAILMELSVHMKAMGQKTAVHWTPREANREADALANGNSSSFDPAKERKFDLAHMGWRILPRALQMGRDAEAAVSAAKRRGALPDRTKKQRRRRLEERLKMTDPW